MELGRPITFISGCHGAESQKETLGGKPGSASDGEALAGFPSGDLLILSLPVKRRRCGEAPFYCPAPSSFALYYLSELALSQNPQGTADSR